MIKEGDLAGNWEVDEEDFPPYPDKGWVSIPGPLLPQSFLVAWKEVYLHTALNKSYSMQQTLLPTSLLPASYQKD